MFARFDRCNLVYRFILLEESQQVRAKVGADYRLANTTALEKCLQQTVHNGLSLYYGNMTVLLQPKNKLARFDPEYIRSRNTGLSEMALARVPRKTSLSRPELFMLCQYAS